MPKFSTETASPETEVCRASGVNSQSLCCEQQLIASPSSCVELQPLGQKQLLQMSIPSYQFPRVKQPYKWGTLMFSCLNKPMPSWLSAGRRKGLFHSAPIILSVYKRAEIYWVTTVQGPLACMSSLKPCSKAESGYYCLLMGNWALGKLSNFPQIHIVHISQNQNLKPKPTCLNPKPCNLQWCSLPQQKKKKREKCTKYCQRAFPGGPGVKKSTFQCRGSLVGNWIPHAMGQLSQSATNYRVHMPQLKESPTPQWRIHVPQHWHSYK